MPLDPQQILSLTDLHGRNLGRVSLQRIEGHQVVGVFTPGDGLFVRDVQIMGVSGFCCQIPNLALTQMPRAVA